ncbi:MAG: STAS domain-containing protein [Nocardioidaceae bacterium]
MAIEPGDLVPSDGGGFDVAVSTAADAAWVRVSGELDIATAAVLVDRINALDLDGRTRVVFDLSGLMFCDARGAAALIAGQDTLLRTGHQVSVSGVPRLTRRLLALTGLDQLLDIR